jgi:hypothetical protein
MSFIADLFSGGAGNLVNSVGNVLDKVITTKGEKMQLDNEIRKAEMQFQTDMAKLSVEEKEHVYMDIASARNTSVTIQTSPNASKLSKNTSSMLAMGATVLTFGLFYILLFQQHMLIKNDTKDVVVYILGVLSAILTQIFSFFFGSSLGSVEKNKMISDLYNKSNTDKPSI